MSVTEKEFIEAGWPSDLKTKSFFEVYKVASNKNGTGNRNSYYIYLIICDGQCVEVWSNFHWGIHCGLHKEKHFFPLFLLTDFNVFYVVLMNVNEKEVNEFKNMLIRYFGVRFDMPNIWLEWSRPQN